MFKLLRISPRLHIQEEATIQTYEQLVSSQVAIAVAKILPPVTQSWPLKQEWMNGMQGMIMDITKQYLSIFPESSSIPISQERVGSEALKYMRKFLQELESRLVAEWPMKIDTLRVEIIKSIRWSNIDENTISRAVNAVEDRPWVDESKIIFYTTLWNELRSSRNKEHQAMLKNIQNRFPNITF